MITMIISANFGLRFQKFTTYKNRLIGEARAPYLSRLLELHQVLSAIAMHTMSEIAS